MGQIATLSDIRKELREVRMYMQKAKRDIIGFAFILSVTYVAALFLTIHFLI